jgi:hypothetical protein
MKRVLALLIITAIGCGPIIQHNVALKSVQTRGSEKREIQVEGTSNHFEDDTVAIDWTLDSTRVLGRERTSGLSFVLRNKTDSPVRILWDEAAYVDENGNSDRVTHQGVKFISRDQPMPPSVVVQGGKLSDTIIPSSNVQYTPGKYGGWSEGSVVAGDVAGKTIRVLLPIEGQGKRTDYTFNFEVQRTETPRWEKS